MIYLIAVYLMCGLGVSLGLDDDDEHYGPTARVILFLVFWVLWPAAFMFAVTMGIRAISTGEPNIRRAERRATNNQ
jgi:hypothetical protein